MAHLAMQLTRNIEIGAVRIHGQDSLEVVTTDGGREVRNLRAEDEPRRWECAGHTVSTDGDMTDYNSILNMWYDSNRGLDTFNFYDLIDDELIRVRFETPLQISAPAPHLRHIDTFTLKECLGE